MDGVLAGFVRALRAAGAEASTAESIDAAKTLALMGWAPRADLKAALGLVLAKSEEEKRIHDEVFDLYFSLPPGAGAPAPADWKLEVSDSVKKVLAHVKLQISGGDEGEVPGIKFDLNFKVHTRSVHDCACFFFFVVLSFLLLFPLLFFSLLL